MIPALTQRAKRIQPSLFSLDHVTAEAIAFLRKHEPPEGYFLGFSGGKDSIVTEHLCRMAGVQFTAYYSATGIDAPEVVRFIRKHYPQVLWLHPAISFWEGIRKKSPPLRMMRWCCDTLKKDPSKHIPLKKRVMGIRAEESASRAARGRISKIGNINQIKPIFHWQEWHVWEFLDVHQLPYPCLYDEGFNRIGCVICPYFMHKNQSQVMRHAMRWPQYYKLFEKTVADWHNNYSEKKDRFNEESPAEYLEAYYRGFENGPDTEASPEPNALMEYGADQPAPPNPLMDSCGDQAA